MSRYPRQCPFARTAVLVACAAAALGGCGVSGTSSRSIVYVDPAQGDEIVRSGSGSVLGMGDDLPGAWVDSRNRDEFEAAHIPGAINVPFQFVTVEQDTLRGYGALVVYGRDYNDPRAEGMTKRMLDLGFDNVHLLRGGMRAWRNESRPLEGTDVDGAAAPDDGAN